MVSKKKHLELILEKAQGFPKPKEELEQYITPSDVAAELLWHAYISGRLQGRVVIDLGCGTGKLSLGAVELGARYVVCIDIDEEALSLASETLNRTYGTPFDILASDVRSTCPIRWVGDCTVVMNPPFGVKSPGADTDFLRVALSTCDTVYSIHKLSEGLPKVLDSLASEYGYDYGILKVFDFPIRYSMDKHRKRVHYVRSVLVMFNSRAYSNM